MNLHSVENEVVLKNEEDFLILEFLIPESSDFFDGHFPEFKLLPAVAQFEIVTRFSKKYFKTQRYVPHIKRIKFSNPIRPDTKLHLEMTLKREKGLVSYELSDANKMEKMYSSGSFSVIDE